MPPAIPATRRGEPERWQILFPFALGLHTQILEAYIQDLQVAYDPTYSQYAQYNQTYQSVFQQTAATLGTAVGK